MNWFYVASSILMILSCYSIPSQSISNSRKQKSPIIDDVSDLKDFKKLLRSKTNILVCYVQSPKESTDILRVFKEVAISVKGQGTLVIIDCISVGKKLCKKMKITPNVPYQIKHYKDGVFHKDYDRKETVTSMTVFMRSPSGDLPWDEDTTAENIVHLLNEESLSRFIKHTNKRALIMFYAPWCGYCKTLKPDYAAAATELKGEAVLAAMDLAKPENSQVGTKYNVTGFPTLIFLENGLIKYPYDGENSHSAIVSFLRDPTARIVTKNSKDKPKESWSAIKSDILHLTEDNFDSIISSGNNVLVVFYAPWCGHCESLKTKYERAASTFKNEGLQGIFAAVDATQENEIAARYNVKGYPTLKFFSEGEFKYDVNLRDEEKLISFMKNPKEPPPPPPEDKPWADDDTNVVHLTKDTFKSSLRKKKHALVMFYAPWCGHCKRAKPEMNAAAEQYSDEPRVLFGAVDCTQDQSLCSDFSIKGYPTIKYFSFFDKERIDYNGPRNASAIIDFMKNPSSTINVTPQMEKEIIEKEVSILTDSNFEEAVASHVPILVMFYVSGCGPCKKIKPAFSAAAKQLQKDNIVAQLALLECSVNTKTAQRMSVHSYPTLKLFVNSEIISEYDGDHSEIDFYNFMKKASSMHKKDEL